MLARLLRNAGTLARHPGMLPAYARWSWAKLLGHDIELPLAGGGGIRGFASFSEYYMTQPPDAAERGVLKRFAHHGMLIDVGAHRGAFALTMAKLAPTATVIAFEPAPATFRTLEANIQRNGVTTIRLERIALCDRVGMARFTNREQATSQNHLVRDGDTDAAESVEVPTSTLDVYAAERGLDRIDFLKIDAEGAEPLILAGASGLFLARKISVALIEICPTWLDHVGSGTASLLAQVAALGYRAHVLAADGTPGPPVADQHLVGKPYINALLLPASEASP